MALKLTNCFDFLLIFCLEAEMNSFISASYSLSKYLKVDLLSLFFQFSLSFFKPRLTSNFNDIFCILFKHENASKCTPLK